MSRYSKRTLEPRIVSELVRIKEIKNKRFCSRHEIIAEVNFPATTPARICIKSNEKGTGFMRNHYHEEFCKNYISKKEFDGVVDKVSLIIGNEYSRKRKLDTKGMDMCTKVLMFLAFLQLVLFFCFALAFIETDGNAYKFITIANAFIGFGIALSIMLYNFCRPYEDSSTFEQMVFKKVNEYLLQINVGYKDINLEWVLIPNHYWMELRMLDKNEKDYDEPHHSAFKGQNNLPIPNEVPNEDKSSSDENGSQLFDDEEDE